MRDTITVQMVWTCRRAQVLLPVVREMGRPRGHMRQEQLSAALARVAAAPWAALPQEAVQAVVANQQVSEKQHQAIF